MKRAKSCAEIAEELGSTRQNTAQILKKSLKKVYNKMLHEHGITSSPTETLEEMITFFQIQDEEDIQEFFKLLPNDIKEEIESDYIRNK